MDSESRPGQSPLLVTRLAMFVAVGLAAGLALSGIPNVELVTAVCFIAGFLLGTGPGLIVGGLTEALFAGFHPMGSSFGPLLLAQVIGMSLAGLFGAVAARILDVRRSGMVYVSVIVGFGFLTTLIFDFLTNLAYPLTAGFSVSQTVLSLGAAIPFAAVHLAGNTLVFGLLVAPLLPRLQNVLRLK